MHRDFTNFEKRYLNSKVHTIEPCIFWDVNKNIYEMCSLFRPHHNTLHILWSHFFLLCLSIAHFKMFDCFCLFEKKEYLSNFKVRILFKTLDNVEHITIKVGILFCRSFIPFDSLSSPSSSKPLV